MASSTVSTDPKAIQHFLDRARENVYPSREMLEKALKTGQRLTIYTGIDPTGPTLHMGHVIWLRKLAELQKMGHQVIMLIGDFTAMIGDPTDKSATRKQLTREEVLANCKLYQEQASKILNFVGSNPAEVKFNADWLAKMTFSDVVELSAHFTVQQMMERDMFQKRANFNYICQNCHREQFYSSAHMKGTEFISDLRGAELTMERQCSDCGRINIFPFQVVSPKPIYLHEFLYPLMQGYDSVAMDVDMEIGGNDQTFNMLAGRTLLREIAKKEKFVLTTKLLVDSTGKKMGKTEGNMITLADSAEDMFGKVMSWTDGMILPGFELCTDVADEEIAKMKSAMDSGENPMTFKRRLGREIVALLISAKAAEEAEAHFSSVHQKGETPEDIPELKTSGEVLLTDVLVEAKLVPSKTEARRQVEQGGVKVDEVVVTDPKAMVKAPATIQKGKRHFVRLVK